MRLSKNYLFLRAQVGQGTIFMKSPVCWSTIFCKKCQKLLFQSAYKFPKVQSGHEMSNTNALKNKSNCLKLRQFSGKIYWLNQNVITALFPLIDDSRSTKFSYEYPINIFCSIYQYINIQVYSGNPCEMSQNILSIFFLRKKFFFTCFLIQCMQFPQEI